MKIDAALAATVAILLASASSLASGARAQATLTTVESLELAIDRALADRAYAPLVPRRHARDLGEIHSALTSPLPAFRRVATRGLGRLQDPADFPQLVALLDDGDARVRDEAANGLGMLPRTANPAIVAQAAEALLAHLDLPHAREALGNLRYDQTMLGRVEAALAPDANGAGGDLQALVSFFRLNRRWPASPPVRAALESLAQPSRVPDVWAWRALQLLGDVPADLVQAGAGYHCSGADVVCGWEIRQAAVEMIDPAKATLATPLDAALHDPAFQVRIVALRRIGSGVKSTGACAPLVDAAADAKEMAAVRLEALSLLTADCHEREAVANRLLLVAADLAVAEHESVWHVPARALEALARVSPAAAARPLGVASRHHVWQVRAAAARAAATIKDNATLVRLADDPVPNVRTAALAGLGAISSPDTRAQALRALESDDFQLAREGAEALKKLPPQADEVAPLLGALRRLTGTGADNSRDPRVAILGRLVALANAKDGGSRLASDDVNRLMPYLEDFDPKVAALAADAIGAAAGTRPDPRPAYRPPQQPTESELRTLPARAVVTMANGDVFEIGLATDEAPVAIARIAALARRGYYDGLTFHRIEPLFVVQGGSPGASEYVGDARFLRDEIGFERHTRGAVGLSTRGADTGDAQLFIDLTDQPRLNFIYTVIGHVIDSREPHRGMAAVEAMLEGAAIKSVRVFDR